MLAGVVQIEVHLPCVRVAELTYLEVHNYERSQTAMKENEVDTKPGVVDTKPAQFQKKVGEAMDERLFQVRLRVFVFEVEEFENERVFDGFFGRHQIVRFGVCGFLQHSGFVL